MTQCQKFGQIVLGRGIRNGMCTKCFQEKTINKLSKKELAKTNKQLVVKDRYNNTSEIKKNNTLDKIKNEGLIIFNAVMAYLSYMLVGYSLVGAFAFKSILLFLLSILALVSGLYFSSRD